MLQLTRFCVLCAVLVVESSPALAAPDVPPISAEVMTTHTLANGREIAVPGRFYRLANGATREESKIGAVITDIAARTITMLSFGGKEAIVFELSEEEPVPRREVTDTARDVGDAQFEGRPVRKIRVQVDGRTQETWTATDIGLVVSSTIETSTSKMTRILSKITDEIPEPSLFSIPEGYKVTKILVPSGMTGGLPSARPLRSGPRAQ